jgi:hypothetical protein
VPSGRCGYTCYSLTYQGNWSRLLLIGGRKRKAVLVTLQVGMNLLSEQTRLTRLHCAFCAIWRAMGWRYVVYGSS